MLHHGVPPMLQVGHHHVCLVASRLPHSLAYAALVELPTDQPSSAKVLRLLLESPRVPDIHIQRSVGVRASLDKMREQLTTASQVRGSYEQTSVTPQCRSN
eukprot:COSAG02_NODE_1001_length_15302_cov_22.687299_5_plen_101_part_00